MKKFGQYSKEVEDCRLLREFSDNSKQYLIEFLNSGEESVDTWLKRRFTRYKEHLKSEIKENFKQYLSDLANSINI